MGKTVLHLGIDRDPDRLYWVSTKRNCVESKLIRNVRQGQLKKFNGQILKEIEHLNYPFRKGYLYYITSNGDLGEAKMIRRQTRPRPNPPMTPLQRIDPIVIPPPPLSPPPLSPPLSPIVQPAPPQPILLQPIPVAPEPVDIALPGPPPPPVPPDFLPNNPIDQAIGQLPIEDRRRLGLELQPIPQAESTTEEETSEEEEEETSEEEGQDDSKDRYLDDMPPLEDMPIVVEMPPSSSPPPLPLAPPPRIQLNPPPIPPRFIQLPPIDTVRAHFNTYAANAQIAIQRGELNPSLFFTISNLQRLLQESEQMTPFIQDALASLPTIPRRRIQRQSAQNITRILGRRGVKVEAPPVV